MWKQGTSGLIDVLARKITGEQGLAVRTANVMMVVGSMHAVDLLARL
jgi:DNA-binding transcriptional MocR family regulator